MRFMKICIFTIIMLAVFGIGLYFMTPKNHVVEESKLYTSISTRNPKPTLVNEYDTKEEFLLKLLNRKIDYSTIELTAVCSQEKGFKWHFNGPADYGKSMVIANVLHEDGKIVLLITGNLDELSDGEAGNTDFQFRYILTKESVEDSLNGVLLKKPLVIGNEWERPYMLDGKTYSVTTRITELRGEFITTESVISGVPDYTNNEYWRKDVFQLGKGLVYYAETIKEDYGGGIFDYYEDGIIDILSEFETNRE